MSGKGFGTLANLAKIMEEASDPESQVREDKRESKPKSLQRTTSEPHKKKAMDPKRKAWYERRLREQMEEEYSVSHAPQSSPIHSQEATRKTAITVSNGLLNVLANAKEAKPKDGSKRPEAWKRKPGDPIF